jgi:3-oxoacyl-[acyl-carrier-protein] synthase III
MPSAAHLPAAAAADTEVRAAGIASIARALPKRVVRNHEVAASAGVSEEWIVARTGVHERRIVEPGERLSDLATAAGQEALERAGVRGPDLDLVLVATIAADELSPNAAPLVALELGAERAGAMDVGAACTGFLSALALASAQVEAGRAEWVLVIGADVMSRFTDRSDRGTAALFADGAGAAVVGPAAEDGGHIGPVVLRADGEGAPAIYATQEERLIRMQGHDTFREAVRRLSESTLQAVEAAGVELYDIDLFVYHQANARILAAVGQQLRLDGERVIDCIDRYGNTSSATLPIALAEAEETGRLHPGATVVLGAFGAGFTWGAGVVRWKEEG